MRFIDKFKVVAWNIGFIDCAKDNLLHIGKNPEIKWMKHRYYDRFFADPFVLSEDDSTITILAEEYLFVEGKGKIVRLVVDKNTKILKSRTLLIETNYHLSYPFIYEETIIPEQNQSGKWIAYTIEGDEKEELASIGYIDGTVFKDGNNIWLFATKKDAANSKLYRYKMNNGKPDKNTEILIKDSLIASRPGGNFLSINGAWYRVAQTSTDKVYGESISLCKVLKCDDNYYEEEEACVLTSKRQRKFNRGIHTLNAYSTGFVVDGFDMLMRPLQRIIIKVRSMFQ